MLRRAVLAALFLLTMIPCAHAAWLDRPVEVAVTESVGFYPDGVRIWFESVPGDVRCPIGMSCEWQGDAEVELRMYNPSDQPDWDPYHDLPPVYRTFVLHTYFLYQRSYDYWPYRVILAGLDPYPDMYGPPYKYSDYVATLLVTRLDVVADEPTSWGGIKSLYR